MPLPTDPLQQKWLNIANSVKSMVNREVSTIELGLDPDFTREAHTARALRSVIRVLEQSAQKHEKAVEFDRRHRPRT